MNREILDKPFPTQLHKTRKGPFGKPLTYVEGAEYIRRLNEAFDGVWSFEVCEQRVYDRERVDGRGEVEHYSEVVVLGKLTTAEAFKQAFGGNDTLGGTPLADALKGAATDALKKAASMFGVGLDLYSADHDKRPAPPKHAPPANQPDPPASVDQPSANQIRRMMSLGQDPRLTVAYRKRLGQLLSAKERDGHLSARRVGAAIGECTKVIKACTGLEYIPWEDLTPGEQNDQVQAIANDEGF